MTAVLLILLVWLCLVLPICSHPLLPFFPPLIPQQNSTEFNHYVSFVKTHSTATYIQPSLVKKQVLISMLSSVFVNP